MDVSYVLPIKRRSVDRTCVTIGRIDRILTRAQVIGAIVGLAIAARGAGEGPAIGAAFRLIGYPLAVAGIVRWVPIVRHRHVGWLVTHELGVAAICVGWFIAERTSGAVINGSWGVIALIWWLVDPAGRKRAANTAAG